MTITEEEFKRILDKHTYGGAEYVERRQREVEEAQREANRARVQEDKHS